MSSQKLVYFFLISASIVGLIVLTVRRISQASCQYDDAKVCSFVQKNQKLNEQNMKGQYKINQEGETLTINWEKEDEKSSIKIHKSNEEILHTILASRYVYIKDFADNKWWREQKNTVANALLELPFNPENYFVELTTIIQDKENVYSFIEETICGDEQCYRYRITNTKQLENEQFFVFFSTKDFKLRSVFKVKDEVSEQMDINYDKTVIQEPEEIKIVSSGRNIFLEYTELRDKEEPKNYEYLQQFQQQRLESEENSTIPYVEEIATGESTLSF